MGNKIECHDKLVRMAKILYYRVEGHVQVDNSTPSLPYKFLYVLKLWRNDALIKILQGVSVGQWNLDRVSLVIRVIKSLKGQRYWVVYHDPPIDNGDHFSVNNINNLNQVVVVNPTIKNNSGLMVEIMRF